MGSRPHKVLNRKWKVHSSTNTTVTLPCRDYTLTAYIKTSLEHCKWKVGAPVDSMVDKSSCIVRVEAKLGLRFLRDRNLLTLESWRDAHERGIYENIFNETVRKPLRLVGTRLRHKTPRPEVYELLTREQARLLRGYIKGLDPREFKGIVQSKNPLKRRSEYRLKILKVASVDIDIPWKDHVKLRCFELAGRLVYSGDYHPVEAHAPWCFCAENWDNLRAEMKQAYEDALSKAATKARLDRMARSAVAL